MPDLAQLFAQVVVALGLGHLLFGAALDAVLHLEDSDFVLQGLIHLGQALHRIIHFQDGLRVGQLEREIRRHQIRHAAGLIHVLQHQRQFGLHGAAQLGHPLHVLLHRAGQRFQFHRGCRGRLLHDVQTNPITGVLRDETLDARTAQTLDENLEPTVGELAHAHDDSDCAGVIERAGLGILLGRFALGDDETQTLIVLQRHLHRV